MLEKRTCGGCTACCKTHSVASISKGAGIWCNHCDIGKGCKIYSDRPSECHAFECQWLKGYGDEKDRPDKSKVVVDFDFLEIEELKEKVLSLWEVSEGALGREFTENMTNKALSSDIPVLHVFLGGRYDLYRCKR